MHMTHNEEDPRCPLTHRTQHPEQEEDQRSLQQGEGEEHQHKTTGVYRRRLRECMHLM